MLSGVSGSRGDYILNIMWLLMFTGKSVMKNMNENSLDELLRWVVSVDRRLILMDSMKKHNIVKASDIAHETQRSTQNISRALKEFENKGLIECLTPEKTTWKKYILTNTGKQVLKKLEGKFL